MRAFGFYRKRFLDGRLPPVEVLRQLETLCAHVISGTPGLLIRLAIAMARDHSSPVRPRMVISGGEVLTEPMRRAIADAFVAPVYDVYGSYEFGVIGWQCPRTGGVHVSDDGGGLEILRNGQAVPPGGTGEVVATQLHAVAAPLIRYRLRDVVT